MGYTDRGSHLKYFVPNIPVAATDAGVMQEIDIGASSADHGEYVCVLPCAIKRLQFTVTGEVVAGTTTAPTVVFTKRPTPLSSSSESVVATLTIPDGTAVGATIFSDLDSPIEMDVGDSLEVSHTVGVGAPTGMGHASFLCYDRPEYHGNNSELSASA